MLRVQHRRNLWHGMRDRTGTYVRVDRPRWCRVPDTSRSHSPSRSDYLCASPMALTDCASGQRRVHSCTRVRSMRCRNKTCRTNPRVATQMDLPPIELPMARHSGSVRDAHPRVSCRPVKVVAPRSGLVGSGCCRPLSTAGTEHRVHRSLAADRWIRHPDKPSDRGPDMDQQAWTTSQPRYTEDHRFYARRSTRSTYRDRKRFPAPNNYRRTMQVVSERPHQQCPSSPGLLKTGWEIRAPTPKRLQPPSSLFPPESLKDPDNLRPAPGSHRLIASVRA